MTLGDLSNKKVIILLPMADFRDEEYFSVRETLETQNAEVLVASSDLGVARGMLKGSVEIDMTLLEIELSGVSAVIFIGGQGAAGYFTDSTALQIVKEAYEKGILIGAICLAPMILANAGILHGKRVTAFSSLDGKLREMGVDYVSEPVMVDGKIITAQRSEDAKEFGEKIAEMLQGS